jgi:hypothetical protein
MGANEDFKRLAKEMAEKARAQREKAAKTPQAPESTEETSRNAPGERPGNAPRPKSDKK